MFYLTIQDKHIILEEEKCIGLTFLSEELLDVMNVHLYLTRLMDIQLNSLK